MTRFGYAVKTMAMTNQRINANIRAELARKSMTQQQVAELLGVSQASVSERVRGEVSWRIDELTRLAEALGLPVSAFLDESAPRAS